MVTAEQEALGRAVLEDGFERGEVAVDVVEQPEQEVEAISGRST
jgi:hypothetical protein